MANGILRQHLKVEPIGRKPQECRWSIQPGGQAPVYGHVGGLDSEGNGRMRGKRAGPASSTSFGRVGVSIRNLLAGNAVDVGSAAGILQTEGIEALRSPCWMREGCLF